MIFPSASQLVILTITLPIWTIVTIYLLILLILYLRSLQYFKYYDKCTPKKAHFTYDFQMVTGKHSSNFNPTDAAVIVDLLDNQSVSMMTIQIPCSTVYMERDFDICCNSMKRLRRVQFTIYRKHPLKEIKSIRIAHSSSNEPDSRLLIYGLQINDSTNKEMKFFPITSVVKYRGTHWALNTSFEMSPDSSFSQIGADVYDPYEHPSWPTYQELLYLIFYIWSSVLFFTYLIPPTFIGGKPIYQALVVLLATGLSAAIIGFVYLKTVKSNTLNQDPKLPVWLGISYVYISVMLVLCVAFCVVSFKATFMPDDQIKTWAINATAVSIILTATFVVIFFVGLKMKSLQNSGSLLETDSMLMKTNSKSGLEFVDQLQPIPAPTKPQPTTQQVSNPNPSTTLKKVVIKAPKTNSTKSLKQKKKGSDAKLKKDDAPAKQRPNDDAIDEKPSEGMYIRTKNRNSISQYV